VLPNEFSTIATSQSISTCPAVYISVRLPYSKRRPPQRRHLRTVVGPQLPPNNFIPWALKSHSKEKEPNTFAQSSPFQSLRFVCFLLHLGDLYLPQVPRSSSGFRARIIRPPIFPSDFLERFPNLIAPIGTLLTTPLLSPFQFALACGFLNSCTRVLYFYTCKWSGRALKSCSQVHFL
jgi:hypothetical protein